MRKKEIEAFQSSIMIDVDCPIDEINALMSFEYHELLFLDPTNRWPLKMLRGL